VLTDANGIPLVVQTGPANQRDDGKLEDRWKRSRC
jgi:hypothetical protein